MDRPAFVGVVVPAHDEVSTVARAIAGVRRALSHPLVRALETKIVVVADASEDGTADRARAALAGDGEVIEVRERNVGAARRAGFEVLLGASHHCDVSRVWFATTDADSVVTDNWIASQLQWQCRGADVVVGTVRPLSWPAGTAAVRRHYERHMDALGVGDGHPHVHGANLAMSRAAYLLGGGFAPLATGEDVAFRRAALQAGLRVRQVGDVVVRTSTRRDGRAPSGFADLLCHMAEPDGSCA